MSNHSIQPSLVRVVKQLSRQWKAVRERRCADGDIPAMTAKIKESNALPIFTLIQLVHDATSIPSKDLEWVAAFIDTPIELTPWKDPGAAMPGWMINPELDGFPYDKVSGENLKFLRSIHEELHKCDEDGRTADILSMLEAKHPGSLHLLRAEEEQRSGKHAKTLARKTSVNARMIDVLGKKPESAGWTAKQFAEELKCSPAAIVGTNAWKSMRLDREKDKAEHASQKAAEKRKK